MKLNSVRHPWCLLIYRTGFFEKLSKPPLFQKQEQHRRLTARHTRPVLCVCVCVCVCVNRFYVREKLFKPSSSKGFLREIISGFLLSYKSKWSPIIDNSPEGI